MNKDQLLKQLNELQVRLDSEVDSYNIDNRFIELEDISQKIEKNKAKIKYYTEQLSNDRNFLDNTPLQYFLMLEAQELENLRAKQAAERENKNKILSEETIISSCEATILAAQEDISKLTFDNLKLNVDIRKARLSSNKEKIASCEAKINENNNRVTELENNINEIKENINEHKTKLEQFNGLTDVLKNETLIAKEKYEKAIHREKEVKNGLIDVAKKNKIENELETLKAVTSTLEQRSLSISYNFGGELKTIISDYQSNVIDESTMKEKLSQLRDKLPENFIKADEVNRNTELLENKNAQEELEKRIEELTTKLADEDNYKASPAQKAKIRVKLNTCRKNMSDYDSQIELLNSEILVNEADLIEYRNIIDRCNEENEEIARELIFNNGVDKELENELIAKQKANFSLIAETNELIENTNIDGIENTQVLSQLQERKARTEKLLASYQADLANENSLDRSSIRLDENELSNCKMNLNSLKNREEFLQNSILVNIDNIIGKDNKISSEEENISPISVGKVNNYNNGEVIIKPSADFSDLSPEKFGGNDEDLSLFGVEKPVLEVNENTKLSDKVEVVSTSEVNDKLKEKSKLPKFKAAMKKHWKKVLAAVTLLVVVMGIKALNKKDIDNATNQIINNPNNLESIVDAEDPQKSLEDFLNENGLEVENSNQNSTKPNNNVGVAQPPYVEKTPENIEQSAPPVDPSTIVDEHPNPTPEPAKPVDPSTIVDEHPDLPVVNPIPLPDQDTIIIGDGVTGDETVPEGAWDNEQPVIEDNEPSKGGSETKPTNPSNGGNVNGDETVPEDAWENEQPVIEDEGFKLNPSLERELPISERPDPRIIPIPEPIPTPVPETTPIAPSVTTTISVNPGDALIVNQNGVNYVSNNGSNYEEKENDQDIFANDDVRSVSVITDENGNNTIDVEINSSSAVRENALTDEDVAAISAENNIDAAEIAEIEAQYKAQQAALEELKQQVQNSETDSMEYSTGKSR